MRLTHLPGIVVECQDERRSIKMRAGDVSASANYCLQNKKASARLLQALLVGSGDRSERIRTYNFPQGRITDHRINLYTS